nr:TraR/DksA family transcriptional regulator [Rhizobium sp. 007]
MNKSSVQTMLQTMKDDLVRRLGAIDADLCVALEKDSEERATQVENDEVLREMQAEGRDQIAAIDAAIDRLNDGTYGQCAKWPPSNRQGAADCRSLYAVLHRLRKIVPLRLLD